VINNEENMNQEMKIKGVAGLILNKANTESQDLGKGHIVSSAAELINQNKDDGINYTTAPYWLVLSVGNLPIANADKLHDFIKMKYNEMEINALAGKFGLLGYRVLTENK